MLQNFLFAINDIERASKRPFAVTFHASPPPLPLPAPLPNPVLDAGPTPELPLCSPQPPNPALDAGRAPEFPRSRSIWSPYWRSTCRSQANRVRCTVQTYTGGCLWWAIMKLLAYVDVSC